MKPHIQDRTDDYYRRLRAMPDFRWIERARAAYAVRLRTYHMHLTDDARACAVRQATIAIEQGHSYDDAVAAGLSMAESLRGSDDE